jgi:type II secretory pathway component PulK
MRHEDNGDAIMMLSVLFILLIVTSCGGVITYAQIKYPLETNQKVLP